MNIAQNKSWINGQGMWVYKASFSAAENETSSLIGSNEGGKTRISTAPFRFNCISSGSISFDGMKIDQLLPQEIVERGISQMPERRMLFSDVTVRESLEWVAIIQRLGEISTAS